jgi:hypothetical protein
MRKFRSTEISGKVNVESNGQHMQANWFCINCNAIGSLPKHYPNCKNKESYAIPATAEVPKKNASKKKWDIFKKQFVFAKPVGWWSHASNSWWYKNNIK